jgi:hypothetical protein
MQLTKKTASHNQQIAKTRIFAKKNLATVGVDWYANKKKHGRPAQFFKTGCESLTK